MVLTILFARNVAMKSIKKEVEMKIIRPLLKLSNEKWSVREWILSNFPENYENMTYIEPYGGGVNMLFHKEKSKFEIINDQNIELVNIFRAIRDEPEEFIRKINLYKCTQEIFEKSESRKNFEDYLDQAVNDMFLRKTSKSELKQKFQKPTNLQSWKKSILEIDNYNKRIKDIFILNKPALEIIKSFDTEDSFLYCDPPYLHENKVSKMVYSSEMTTECHMDLYRSLNNFNGKVVLSGCMSPLYNRLYKNWNISKKRINKTEKEKATEVIWKNF
jgi:DNA adenine methylase